MSTRTRRTGDLVNALQQSYWVPTGVSTSQSDKASMAQVAKGVSDTMTNGDEVGDEVGLPRSRCIITYKRYVNTLNAPIPSSDRHFR